MFNQKSNLYRNEWLNLVFANRNQLYGAYELRQNYSGRLARALLLSIVLFPFLITAPVIYNKFAAKAVITPDLTQVIDVSTFVYKPKPLPKQTSPVTQNAGTPLKANTQRNSTPTVVRPDEVMEEMPAQVDLQQAAIGLQDGKGENVESGGNGTGKISAGDGMSTEGTSGNEPFTSVEQMPEFPGGHEAFYKYLSKNIRYPAMAQENNIQGRIIVSFIVERNGELTDIHILRGIGGGCDEEAIRVIKKAPTWKPGVQNGQKVRVQYTVPVVFNL